MLPSNELAKLEAEPKFQRMEPLHQDGHYIFWTFIATVIFGSIITIFLIVRMCQKKKTYRPIVVRAVPSTPGPQPLENQQLVTEATT